MRLRNWIAVVVSVVLLIAAGAIGVLVNRSALRAADTVHRADTQALAVNNTTLSGQMQLVTAGELKELASTTTFRLGKGNAADRRALDRFVAKTNVLKYGAAITDLRGTVLNATRSTGLPSVGDPGYTRMREELARARPGFSSVMLVDGVAIEAVAIPLVRNGAPVAVLVGFMELAKTPLQGYVATLSDSAHLTEVIDSGGRIGYSSDGSKIGTMIDPAVTAAARHAAGPTFVQFTSGKTPTIAIVVPGMPGGWSYVRSQSLASFEGAVHSKSQTLNVTLLAMLLIGVIGITLLGYRTQIQRRRSDERFQALFQHAPDMVSVLDPTGRIAFASPSAASLLNVPSGSMQGTSVFDIIHPDDRERIQAAFAALLGERDGVKRMQSRVFNADGTYRWFEITASNKLHNRALAGIVINARDVSENRAFQERLTHEALHDALTGLPNRRRMQDALDSTLSSDAVAVLFVDLDGFKPVNDMHGHEAGDELLRQVADRLSACVRAEDVLARVGGDEFVVLMPGILDQADADAMSARVCAAIETPFQVYGSEVTIGASVGVHLAAPKEDSDLVLRAADHAMYAVKKAGGGRRARLEPEPVRVGRHRAAD
ncbi:PAS domain S-box-containing protein/diguanylate cyclase (GGDEF)-like protein [Krasilnikovia cinnamomea]|uniref:PAS domain S-box-containing protein/diguanylate cyclase (GGDEF)-like protein n=1 Tax=Krasilnikovia cinnamomea TaxID=349313 RepID=A0A4Q7ZFI6_9ACTN|nr:sensor domain-containing diguanylate cyclase [Krasilnikovia cinnamomea]RZU49530.1 PAS domain S-box-containing protein/diguanylate cyclase (GGDEF)-like protein [Krasilnikovia cinnamomea]